MVCAVSFHNPSATLNSLWIFRHRLTWTTTLWPLTRHSWLITSHVPGFVTLPTFGSSLAIASAHFQQKMPWCRIGGSRLDSIKPLQLGLGWISIHHRSEFGRSASTVACRFLVDHSVFGCVFGDGVKHSLHASLVGEETPLCFLERGFGVGCCSPVSSAPGLTKTSWSVKIWRYFLIWL